MASNPYIFRVDTSQGTGDNYGLSKVGNIGGSQQPSEHTFTQTISKVWSATALVRQAAQITEQVIYREMGNADLQQKIDATQQIILQEVGIGLAFATGGVVAGLAATAAVGLSYVNQIAQTEYQKKWEQMSLTEARLRAGASFNRSRTR